MNGTKPGRTPIGDLGKYGLIYHITGNFRTRNKTTIIGSGDDSAVMDQGESLTLISTDLLLEGIHFNLVYTPLRHLGYKAVIRAISDIYAMNGVPGQVLIALGISSRFSVEQIEEIYDGINLACKNYNIDLAGGDTTSSMTGLTISVTGIGTVEKDRLVKRNGARENDLICVTGDLGAAYMGLQLLEREKKLFEEDRSFNPDLSGYEYVIGRQLKPELPVKVLNELREKDITPTSMIDITEGLAPDLLHICRASGCGCRIFHERIPVDHETASCAEEFNIDSLVPALNGGDDFEIVCTVPLDKFEMIESIPSLKIIGHITNSESGCHLSGDNGSMVEITAQGWKNK